MTDTQKIDWRRQIAEYVAGEHRVTRHADLCLDPELAAAIDEAQTAVALAQSAVDDAENTDGDNDSGRIGKATPLASARRDLKAAQKRLDTLTSQARDKTIRFVLSGLSSSEFSKIIAESDARPKDQRQQWQNINLPLRCLSAVTTVDGDPTDIDKNAAESLLKALPIGLLSPIYGAAIEACTAGQNIPF
ncbi:hypothetical protein FYJ43_04365 [Cutibacterium sp. WCA-380-WT-3A]|uniref:Uncharacterized protein n=1 Tax=Cutibacterium porci TaxID=2605781 RepID=A0A7K0J5S1_9ACTN|nr:hypothetical protein [Cutibacterium porci]MSS45291.1 hypothetical protein [Cutibacterium porci]